MAAIDFPSAPTMGQEYPFGDFIYVWDGVKWTTKVIVGESGGGGGSQTFVSELPPTNADAGSTWFCTANGLTYILYADGDSTQWVEANPNYPIATGLFTPVDIGALPSASYNPRSDSLNNTENTVPVFIGDCNTLTAGSFCTVDCNDTNTSNAPDNTVAFLYMETKSTYSSTALIQTAWPYSADADDFSGDMWFRIKSHSGDWRPWRRVYDTDNPPTPSEVGAVAKAGDTMTGTLLIDRGNQHLQLKENDSGQTYTIESTANNLRFYDFTNAGVIADITLAGGFLQKVPQSSSGESLTRKDYVDASIPTRKKSECHWVGLNHVLTAGVPVNIITLLNQTVGASGSWAPMFNPTTGKLTPFNDDRTVTFKLNLMGTFAGGSTNRALQLDFTGTVGNRIVVMRDSGISPPPNSIQFATFFSVDKDGNMALNGTEPMVTALGGNFTITEALIIAEQETTEG